MPDRREAAAPTARAKAQKRGPKPLPARAPTEVPIARSPLTREQREAHRQSNRAYAARKRAVDAGAENTRHREVWKTRHQRRNEQRRAKHDRDWNRGRRDRLRVLINIWADCADTASVVEANSLRDDLTVYRGPGARLERALEAQANRLLAAAAETKAPSKKEHVDKTAHDPR